MHETADALMTELGRLIGMPNLQLDDSGLCELVIDDQWCITIAHHRSRNCLFLHCVICPADIMEKLERSALLMMLKGNFPGNGPDGIVFAIDPGGHAGLQLEVPLGACPDGAMLQAVDRVLREAEAWSARLAVSTSAPDAAPGRPRAPRIKMMA